MGKGQKPKQIAQKGSVRDSKGTKEFETKKQIARKRPEVL